MRSTGANAPRGSPDESPTPGEDPAVSVLLPCRHAEAWLPACIESLEAQTLGAFEVLAVDDGSSDATPALLEAWAARDPRVRVLSTGGTGLVPALTVAAERARAPLLARMDADDVARPGRLAAQRDFLGREPGIAACGTAVRLFPRDALGSGYRRYERWINSLHDPAELDRDLFVECPIAHPTLMVRRAAFESAGGYRDPGWPEDYDLLMRLRETGAALANLPDVLLEWRVRPKRLSLRSAAYGPAAFHRCKVHYLLQGALGRAAGEGRPTVVWGAGRVGKAFSNALRQRGGELEAFVDLDPRKVGQEIHGARVLDPPGLERRLRRGPRPYVLAAVGSPGSRGEIRSALQGMGMREIVDFRAVA